MLWSKQARAVTLDEAKKASVCSITDDDRWKHKPLLRSTTKYFPTSSCLPHPLSPKKNDTNAMEALSSKACLEVLEAVSSSRGRRERRVVSGSVR